VRVATAGAVGVAGRGAVIVGARLALPLGLGPLRVALADADGGAPRDSDAVEEADGGAPRDSDAVAEGADDVGVTRGVATELAAAGFVADRESDADTEVANGSVLERVADVEREIGEEGERDSESENDHPVIASEIDNASVGVVIVRDLVFVADSESDPVTASDAVASTVGVVIVSDLVKDAEDDEDPVVATDAVASTVGVVTVSDFVNDVVSASDAVAMSVGVVSVGDCVAVGDTAASAALADQQATSSNVTARWPWLSVDMASACL
jgi:hypothetical protein